MAFRTKEFVINPEQAERFFSVFFKYKRALLVQASLIPNQTSSIPEHEDGERKALLCLKAEKFLFDDFEIFLKDNYPKVWEEFFQEKK